MENANSTALTYFSINFENDIFLKIHTLLAPEFHHHSSFADEVEID